MRYGLTVGTAPAAEPVTTAEAQTHLRVDSGIDDSYIDSLIVAARVDAEDYTRRALITQTLVLTLDRFPADGVSAINLPRSPLQSVTSIAYTDENGDPQTLSSSKYTVDTKSIVPRIVPAYGESWPGTQDVINAVTVTFVAGYGDSASDVPQPIKHAIKIMVGTWYDPVRSDVSIENKAFSIPMASRYLLGKYIVGTNPWGGA